MLNKIFIISLLVFIISACGENNETISPQDKVNTIKTSDKPIMLSIGKYSSQPVEVSRVEVNHIKDAYNPDANLNRKAEKTIKTNPSVEELPTFICDTKGIVTGGLQYYRVGEDKFESSALLAGLEVSTDTQISIDKNAENTINITFSGVADASPQASGGGTDWSAAYMGSAESRFKVLDGQLILTVNNLTNMDKKLIMDWQFDGLAMMPVDINTNSYVDAKWHATASINKTYRCDKTIVASDTLFNYKGSASDHTRDNEINVSTSNAVKSRKNSDSITLNLAPGHHQFTIAIDLLARAEVLANKAYQASARLDGIIRINLTI